MRKICFLLFLVSALSSCKVIHSLRELKTEEAKVYTFTAAGKDIHFIPLHHLGKQEFYDDLARKVKQHKQEGYKVYYELITWNFTADSLHRDSVIRKARKLKGYMGTHKDNVEGTFLDKYVLQPSYPTLGTDSTDFRADVNYLQIVNKFEEWYGEIVLDSVDMNTPLKGEYKREYPFKHGQYKSVIVGYRNTYLANLVATSTADKILVLYGEGHRKGFSKELDKLSGK